jgi:hypothetical protein
MAHQPHQHHDDHDAYAHGEHDEELEALQECIEECLNCHAVCTNTAQLCLDKGERFADAAHVRLLLDCAQICQASADFMLRGSDFTEATCALCAEVCQACEASCRELEDDEDLAACADVCAVCATSCARMADMEA